MFAHRFGISSDAMTCNGACVTCVRGNEDNNIVTRASKICRMFADLKPPDREYTIGTLT